MDFRGRLNRESSLVNRNQIQDPQSENKLLYCVFKGLGIKRTVGIIWNFLKGAGNLPSGFLCMFPLSPHTNVKQKAGESECDRSDKCVYISLFLPLHITSTQQLVLVFVSAVCFRYKCLHFTEDNVYL